MKHFLKIAGAGAVGLAWMVLGGCDGPRRVTVVEGPRRRVTRVHRPRRRDVVVVEKTVPAPRPAPARVMVLKHRPPAPRKVKIKPARPSVKHVWIPGCWQRVGNKWKWKSGHWALRPRAQAVWVPGRWVKSPGGWRFAPGRWR